MYNLFYEARLIQTDFVHSSSWVILATDGTKKNTVAR